MTKRNCAAVHVYFFRIQFELFHNGNSLNGESLVELDKIYGGEIPSNLGHQFTNRFDWSHHDKRRLNSTHGLADDSRHWFFAEGCGAFG